MDSDLLTLPSNIIAPGPTSRLTPAMVSALWVIADELDSRRLPENRDEAIWLEIPTKRLRPSTRTDNAWLKECLDRLLGQKLEGGAYEENGDYEPHAWGAVLIAEWHIVQGGSLCRILVPPKGIHALKMPATFAKIEAEAAYRLEGPARRLYAALADKKRLRESHWTYSFAQLRDLLGVGDKKSYERWQAFKQWVLVPALNGINDFGTVKITAKPQKTGRAITGVRFDWKWKNVDEACETEEENKQPKGARHMDRKQDDAPPLTDEQRLKKLRDEHFKAWLEKNPGSSFVDFMRSPEYRQLRAEPV